ncbi:hypothetical protein LK540_16450 [Massilia sp. IC2-278]|uniref:hypothetical protein n=1 Tax=Massilia sp. IC2-278 TaxID=2887200 RepID=UPI001E43DE88|nr:hypothetical protein [Massilia sp. IC2-278]MCC2962020.1 hypothetical protein [Massilia sp. IC2-278]
MRALLLLPAGYSAQVEVRAFRGFRVAAPKYFSGAAVDVFVAVMAPCLCGPVRFGCKVAHKHFFEKNPQGFAEGSVKEFKRAENAAQETNRTLIAAPN